jgi:hypothetical protein
MKNMSNRANRCLCAAALVLCACSSAAAPATAPEDAGSSQDAGALEASPREAAAPEGGDASNAVDGGRDASSPAPTLLQAGAGFTLWGLTADGYALYSTSATFYAAPIGGGAAMNIAPNSSISGAFTIGNLAILMTNLDPSTGVISLTVWSSAAGAHKLSAASSYYALMVSPDSRYVAFLDQVDSSGETGSLVVAMADGTGATTLVQGIGGIATGTCTPELAFTGSQLVASYCSGADAGAGPATLSTFSESSWTRSDLLTTLSGGYTLDGAGTQALVTSALGLQVVPLAGATVTTIDAHGTGGVFTSDGQNVLYTTSASSLVRASVANPAPVTLVPSGVGGIYDLSPDDQFVLAYQNYNTLTGLSDLYLASATTPGSLVTLSSAQTAAVVQTTPSRRGSGFTSDSSRVLFLTDVTPGTYMAPTEGTLDVTTSKGSTPSAALGQNALPSAWTWGSSKVIFATNAVTLSGISGTTVDIDWVDTSTSGAPTRLVGQATVGSPFAGAPFFLSPAQNRIVYTSTSGLYALPLP